MHTPDSCARISHRLTVGGLDSHFTLSLTSNGYPDTTFLDVDAATALRDQLTAWIDEQSTDKTARSVSDDPVPPPNDSVVRRTR
jgi:hypothetical protein